MNVQFEGYDFKNDITHRHGGAFAIQKYYTATIKRC